MKTYKAFYVDTRWRHGGKTYSDDITLEKCYECSKCNLHIFESNFNKNKCICPYCGSKLKIERKKKNG